MLHCFLLTDTIPYIYADRDSRKKCTWVSSSPCFFMKWKIFGNPTWHRLLGKCPGKLGSRGTCGSFSFCELWMWALLTFCLLEIRTAWWPNVASFLILKIYSQSTFVFAISVILFFFFWKESSVLIKETFLWNRRPLHKTTTNQNTRSQSPVPVDTFTTHSLTYGSEDRTESLQMAEGFGVFCEILSPNNVRSYTLNVSRMRLPKNELKKKRWH